MHQVAPGQHLERAATTPVVLRRQVAESIERAPQRECRELAFEG